MGRNSVLFTANVPLIGDCGKKLSEKESRNKTMINALIKETMSVDECAETFGITRQTVNNISNRYITYGVSGIFDSVGVKRNVKLTESDDKLIENLLDNKKPSDYGHQFNYWSIKVLHNVLVEFHKINVCYSTIFNHVHQLGYSFKMPCKSNYKADDEAAAKFEVEIKKKSKHYLKTK